MNHAVLTAMWILADDVPAFVPGCSRKGEEKPRDRTTCFFDDHVVVPFAYRSSTNERSAPVKPHNAIKLWPFG